VNHSLANLNTETDVNPFALREPDMLVKGRKLEYVIVQLLTTFWYLTLNRFSREEAEKYVQESHQMLEHRKPESK